MTRMVRRIAALVFLLVLAVWAYAPSLTGPFIFFDDHNIIQRNARIHTLWPPWIPLGGTERPLTQWSFAVNYAVGRFDPWGYHAVTLALHLLAALALFDLVRRTLARPRAGQPFGPAAPWLAWTSAALWAIHPLHTQSVAYLAQRSEVLAGLWSFVTLDAVALGAVASGRGWYLAAVLACLLGMLSKPVTAVVPVAVLLYDRYWVAGSWRQAWRQRWGLYLGFAATWGILGVLIATNTQGLKQHLTGFLHLAPTAVSDAAAYAATQPGVILHYLRLIMWPVGLCFDYAWPAARTAAEIVPPALGLGALLAAVGWWLRRDPAVGFWAAWGFLALAPSSSIVPRGELAVEHRMYLPLAGFVTALVLLGWRTLHRFVSSTGMRRAAALLVASALAALGGMTWRRAHDYRDALTIWRDTAAKRPENPRAQYNLGNALIRAQRYEEAVAPFILAIALRPHAPKAHNNLASAYLLLGQLEPAAAHCREALRLDPHLPEAHNNIGTILLQQGRLDEAIAHFETALRLNPDFAGARHNLAAARAQRRDRAPDASPQAETASER